MATKKRTEIEERLKWKLEDIFPTNEDWEKEFSLIKAEVDAFAKYEGKVSENPLEALSVCSALGQRLSRLYGYCFMRKDEDNTVSLYQGMTDRAMSLYVAFSAACSFIEPELLEMPVEKLEEMQKDAKYADYSERVRLLIRSKAHMLPKEQEKLIAMTGELAQTPDNVFTMLTSADMKFPDILDSKGEKHTLTEGSFVKSLMSEDRTLRKNAFDTLFSTYEKWGNTIAAAYSGNVKADMFNRNARGFESCMQMSLYPFEIPTSVYHNLIDVVSQNIPTVSRYVELRKKALGLDEVHPYDMYVSMIPDADKKMTYDEEFELVCEGLAPLGEDYIKVLRRAKEERWIDVYENEGKSSGAYSNGLYGCHPYILLNNQDNLESALTLAHELGHTMHSYFSNGTQSFEKADYSLFVAEVASTCNEMLLMSHMLDTMKDETSQKYLCNVLLESFRTTMVRQTMFAEFELNAHTMAENGQPLTKDALSDMYYKLNQKYYGEKEVLDDLLKVEWMRIPHFYRSFYVYVYATGFAAAVFLANRIRTEGAPAVADYKKFLSAGCSVGPLDALRLAGVDMEKPEAVHAAMKVFAETLDKLENLLK